MTGPIYHGWTEDRQMTTYEVHMRCARLQGVDPETANKLWQEMNLDVMEHDAEYCGCGAELSQRDVTTGQEVCLDCR